MNSAMERGREVDVSTSVPAPRSMRVVGSVALATVRQHPWLILVLVVAAQVVVALAHWLDSQGWNHLADLVFPRESGVHAGYAAMAGFTAYGMPAIAVAQIGLTWALLRSKGLVVISDIDDLVSFVRQSAVAALLFIVMLWLGMFVLTALFSEPWNVTGGLRNTYLHSGLVLASISAGVVFAAWLPVHAIVMSTRLTALQALRAAVRMTRHITGWLLSAALVLGLMYSVTPVATSIDVETFVGA